MMKMQMRSDPYPIRGDPAYVGLKPYNEEKGEEESKENEEESGRRR